MEQQFEIVDRDYYSENFEGVTSRDRGIVEKIKLTEQSRNNMDSKYQNVIGAKNVEKSAEEVATEIVEDAKDNTIITSVEQNEFEVSRVIPTSKKAIKFAEYMVENTDKKYAGYNVETPTVNVEDVDTEEMKEVVDSNFNFYNINQEPETTYEKEDVEEEKYEPSKDYEEKIEETTLDSLVSSSDTVDMSEQEEVQAEPYYAYEEKISNSQEEKNQDVETTPVENTEEIEINSNIVPEIENYFSTHDLYDIDGSINDVSEQETNEVAAQEIDLYDEVSNSIDDENITIEDLDKLREALQNERDRKARLTHELEEQQMAAAAAEREEQEAVKEREAKIIEFNDALNALRNENAGLQKQTEIIEEKTQETNSNVVNIRDYVSALDRIMNESSYNSGDMEASVSRGKAA